MNPVRNPSDFLQDKILKDTMPNKISNGMNKKTKNKKIEKVTDFQVHLAKNLKNKEFKNHYDEYGRQLEISYRVLQLRKKAKMSQLELARKIGTTQSNIARMEGGRQNFTLNTLNKIASIFDKQLKVSIC